MAVSSLRWLSSAPTSKIRNNGSPNQKHMGGTRLGEDWHTELILPFSCLLHQLLPVYTHGARLLGGMSSLGMYYLPSSNSALSFHIIKAYRRGSHIESGKVTVVISKQSHAVTKRWPCTQSFSAFFFCQVPSTLEIPITMNTFPSWQPLVTGKLL